MRTQKFVFSNEALDQKTEDCMKECKLQSLEEDFGELMEDILLEVFVNKKEDESIDERSIYDLSTEEEISRRLKRESEVLNEGCAEVENLELLEKQAKDYFDNPTYVHIPEERTATDWVTGFIQLNAGVQFDSQGAPVEMWKSFGEKLICDAELLSDPDGVIKKVEETGIQWSELVRVVFYGKSLENYVGSRIYITGEKKQLASLSDEYRGIQLAIPSYEDCDSDESIFSKVDELVKASIQYGNDPGISRVTMGHYEMTLARLDELKLEEIENQNNERVLSMQKRNVKRRNDFDAHFKEAREVIKALNSGEVKISELINKESRFLSQMMYLCQKKGERIENPALFFQLKALANKRKCEEMLSSQKSGKAIELINHINSGRGVEVHLLDLDELQELFNVLWSGTGLRINKEHKTVYFELKERFSHLKKVHEKAAA